MHLLLADVTYNGSQPVAAASFASLMIISLFTTGILVVSIAGLWKIFTKAGEEGWKAIIPIYNLVVLFKLVGLSPWLLLLYLLGLVPILGYLVSIGLGLVVALQLAKAFGKSTLFGVFGLFIFSIVGYLMLGFGDATYIGPNGSAANNLPPTPPSEASPPTNPPVGAPSV